MGTTGKRPVCRCIDISELFAAEIGVGTSVGPYSNLEATGAQELAADLVDYWFDTAAGASN